MLVYDGLATRATMRAAVGAVRQLGATSIVVAIPVGAPDSCELIANDVDELVCLASPPDFHAVGQYYEDFSQTTDEQVRALLLAAPEEATRR